MFAKGYLASLETWLGPEISDGAVHHNERWDAAGYPDRLAGADIPLFGRIVAVADAFDVMTHSRSYKTPGPIDEARQKLAIRHRGSARERAGRHRTRCPRVR